MHHCETCLCYLRDERELLTIHVKLKLLRVFLFCLRRAYFSTPNALKNEEIYCYNLCFNLYFAFFSLSDANNLKPTPPSPTPHLCLTVFVCVSLSVCLFVCFSLSL